MKTRRISEAVSTATSLVQNRKGLRHARRPKRFKCTTCTKRFSSRHCLREHSYKHSNLKPYACTRCNKKFRHASQFTLHKNVHKRSAVFLWPRLDRLDIVSRVRYELIEFDAGKHTLPLITGPCVARLPLCEGLKSLRS